MRRPILPAMLLCSALVCAQSARHAVAVTPADDTPIDNGTRFIGPEGYTWSAQTATKPYSLALHGGAYRIEMHTDDHWSHDVAEGKTQKNRTEISGLQAPIQGKSSLRYELMVEQADFTAPRIEHILGQRHGKGDKDDKPGEHPDIAFRILPGGRPSLTVDGSTEQPLVHITPSITAWTGTAAEFALKKWHTVRIDAMQGADGWVDLWLDGAWKKAPGAAHTYSGSFGYVNAAPDYWKFGDYCPLGLSAPVVVWYKNIQFSGV